ncbi:MAG: hypothetical protein K6E97_09070, partial [Treponema sp.]|nr:hypothetical protein [Treponema sp.]
MKDADNEFEYIDVNSFFDSTKTISLENERVDILTEKQKKLINNVMPAIRKKDALRADSFQDRISDLQELANAIARFPPLLEKHELVG